jgi:hypothetical protein
MIVALGMLRKRRAALATRLLIKHDGAMSDFEAVGATAAIAAGELGPTGDLAV